MSPLAHAISQPKSDSVDTPALDRRVFPTGTAIASAMRRALAFASVPSYIPPPIDGLPAQAEPIAGNPPTNFSRIIRLMQPGLDANRNPKSGGPHRLMRSDPGRYVNAMPCHAMAAGGRPMIVTIPGK